MKDNADVLGVEYLIWQGKIWSVARDAEGWRPYNGGGMHDPASNHRRPLRPFHTLDVRLLGWTSRTGTAPDR